jgi:iron complex transport system substrate-binding protein
MRIVSLLPSATELLFAIGAGDQVVAVTHECDHPPGAAPCPRSPPTCSTISGGRRRPWIATSTWPGTTDPASTLSTSPPWKRCGRTAQELCDVCAVAYRDVAAAVRRLPGSIDVLSLEPSTLADIVATVTTRGEVTEHQQEAAVLAASMSERIAAIASSPRPRPEPVAVCVEWTDPIMAGGHWVPEMVRISGGRDPLGLAGEPSRYVEWEAVREAHPDVLVLMPCGFGLDRTIELAPEITGLPGFGELPCARSGRVVGVVGSAFFNRPGPRIVDGLEIMAAVLQAEPGSPLPRGAAWVTLA